MAAREQQAAQLAVVVDLPVEDDPDRAVFVRDRLASSGQINDREAAHAHRDARLDVMTFTVRPAVLDHATHPRDQIARARRVPHQFRPTYSDNATHNIWRSTARVSKRLTDQSAACLRARYC